MVNAVQAFLIIWSSCSYNCYLMSNVMDYLTQYEFSASWSSHGNVDNGNGCIQSFAIITPIFSLWGYEGSKELNDTFLFHIFFCFSKCLYNEILLHSFLHAGLSEQTPMWEPSQRSVWWSLSSERLRTPIPAKTFSPGEFCFYGNTQNCLLKNWSSTCTWCFFLMNLNFHFMTLSLPSGGGNIQIHYLSKRTTL